MKNIKFRNKVIVICLLNRLIAYKITQHYFSKCYKLRQENLKLSKVVVCAAIAFSKIIKVDYSIILPKE